MGAKTCPKCSATMLDKKTNAALTEGFRPKMLAMYVCNQCGFVEFYKE